VTPPQKAASAGMRTAMLPRSQMAVPQEQPFEIVALVPLRGMAQAAA